MPKKVLYYIILVTGIVVCLVGLITFITNYGLTSFPGIWGQITGIICLIGGGVNLMVANKIKQDIQKKASLEKE